MAGSIDLQFRSFRFTLLSPPYMFASARKRHFNQLENDQVEKQSDSEIITEIPSTIMVDTTGIVTENVLEDQQQEPDQGVVSGWREKLGFSRKVN
ncbi:uncharacterized protein LOC101210247 isoform X2 [Cucumis sativus]|uniref:uncharacterized protein LOC101210247 isoform X2 n=1 Tax=Cucumis sativus TaxID=3659 RepID=UPI0005EC0F27|nr:uncharacterized protein LOC101210247 isoform X2 [Cucumis sativus]KGN66613.2 hypothetical protein Csa_007112 [Cucumis sativus]